MTDRDLRQKKTKTSSARLLRALRGGHTLDPLMGRGQQYYPLALKGSVINLK